MISEWPMPQVVKLDIEPNHRAASEIRGQLRMLLEANGVARPVVADVELAASELLANAVNQRPTEPVELLVSVDELSVHITVTNKHEPGRAAELPDVVSHGDILSEQGRGLEIVRALADGMWIHEDHTSTSVSFLHKRH